MRTIFGRLHLAFAVRWVWLGPGMVEIESQSRPVALDRAIGSLLTEQTLALAYLSDHIWSGSAGGRTTRLGTYPPFPRGRFSGRFIAKTRHIANTPLGRNYARDWADYRMTACGHRVAQSGHQLRSQVEPLGPSPGRSGRFERRPTLLPRSAYCAGVPHCWAVARR